MSVAVASDQSVYEEITSSRRVLSVRHRSFGLRVGDVLDFLDGWYLDRSPARPLGEVSAPYTSPSGYRIPVTSRSAIVDRTISDVWR